MKREFVCIVCPNGCDITTEGKPGEEGFLISGEGCKRGREYVLSELTEPRRTISTSVKVRGGEMDLCSVRLTKPIPLARVKEACEVIHGLTLTAPVEEGRVILSDICGLGSDVIATRSVGKR